MQTFFLFGKYSAQAVKTISADRTRQVKTIIEKLKGKVLGIYILMGETDLAIIAEFPGNEQALKASVMLAKITDIGFATVPALTVEQFDQLVG